MNLGKEEEMLFTTQDESCKLIYILIKVGRRFWDKGIVHSCEVLLGEEVDDLILEASFDHLFNEYLPEPINFAMTKLKVLPVCHCLHKLAVEDEKLRSTSSNQWAPLKLKMDGYLLSCLMDEVRKSTVYRQNFLTNIFNYYQKKRGSIYQCMSTNSWPFVNVAHAELEVKLKRPRAEVLDSAWNWRIVCMINERRELEFTMAWLSTLGGAFSSLGDYYVQCAETAGKISCRQMKIALRLGDPITVSRCKVYLAISCLQRGYTVLARRIVRAQYKFATSLPENQRDSRLVNMCLGVWARLQYMRHLKRTKRGLGTLGTPR
jgi:hypothetical protein